MAQVTGESTFRSARVWITTGTTWVEMSGALTSVAGGGGERVTGSVNTAESDYALIGAGPLAPETLTVNYVYSEGSTGVTGIYSILHTTRTTSGGGTFGVRYAIKASTGQFQWSSDTGTNGTILVSAPHPSGDVSSGDPIVGSFETLTKKFTKGTTS